MFNAFVFGRLLTCMHACVADMLEGKVLIIYMVLTMYFILSAVLKWRSVYFRQDMRKIDDSCTDKEKELYP